MVAMVSNLKHMTCVIKTKLCVKFAPCTLSLRAKVFAKPIFASISGINKHEFSSWGAENIERRGSENFNPNGFLLFELKLVQNSEK